MESRLKSIIDRIGSGALKSFGIDNQLPVGDGLPIHGQALVLCGGSSADSADSDTTTTNSSSTTGTGEARAGGSMPPGLETWGEAWDYMRKARDFSLLGPGLMRVAALHPFCAWAECQEAMWRASGFIPSPSLGGPVSSATSRAMLSERNIRNMREEAADALGTPLERLGDLPLPLAQSFLDWRLGWLPLTMQLPQLNGHANMHIIDFSCFQIAPHHFTSLLREAVEPFWGPAQAGSLSRAESNGGSPPEGQAKAGGGGGAGDAGSEETAAEGFKVCSTEKNWDAASWDAWYGTPCFSKVETTAQVEPVCKLPIGPDALPPDLRPALRQAFAIYVDLVKDQRAILAPPSAHESFCGVDPLHDQLWWIKRAQPKAALHVVVDHYFQEQERGGQERRSGDLRAGFRTLMAGSKWSMRDLVGLGLVLTVQLWMLLQVHVLNMAP